MELFRNVFATDIQATSAGTAAEPVPQQVSRLWFDSAGTPFPHQLPARSAAFGTDRILCGSDYRFTPAAGTAAQVASLDEAPQPAGSTWRALTTCDARRLFPPLGT
ncbi:hypothetical protein ACH4VS_25835 [Streptomyces hygroscopicus]|uniref:hypothetical protein n=1 Tax=Streptomyces hygroscopicus TaxID=1912 RepID=UPI00082CFFAE|nr:hypothetical protein Shyhy02_42510 [Streptomyces hygroscopicus subsp. hygroscopicus]